MGFDIFYQSQKFAVANVFLPINSTKLLINTEVKYEINLVPNVRRLMKNKKTHTQTDMNNDKLKCRVPLIKKYVCNV